MSEQYKVKLTRYALGQLKEITSYITDILMVSRTAETWLTKMEREMESLSLFPHRIALTPEEPWHSEGVHRMLFNNFFVYFWVDEDTHTVWITSIVYARRDQTEQLKEMPLQ